MCGGERRGIVVGVASGTDRSSREPDEGTSALELVPGKPDGVSDVCEVGCHVFLLLQQRSQVFGGL